jgi:hypothetical protein
MKEFNPESFSNEEIDAILGKQESQPPEKEFVPESFSNEQIDNILRDSGSVPHQDYKWPEITMLTAAELLFSGIEGGFDLIAGAGTLMGKAAKNTNTGRLVSGLSGKEELKAPFSGEELIGEFSPVNVYRRNFANTQSQRDVLNSIETGGEFGQIIPQLMAPIKSFPTTSGAGRVVSGAVQQGALAATQALGKTGDELSALMEGGINAAAFGAMSGAGRAVKGASDWFSKFFTPDTAKAEEAAVRVMSKIQQTAKDKQRLATFEEARKVKRGETPSWQKYDDSYVTEGRVLTPDDLGKSVNKSESKMRAAATKDQEGVKNLVRNLYDDAFKVDISNIETNKAYKALQSSEPEMKKVIDEAFDILSKGKNGNVFNPDGTKADILFKFHDKKGIYAVSNWDAVKRFLQQNADKGQILTGSLDDKGRLVMKAAEAGDEAVQKRAISLITDMMDDATGGKYYNARIVAQRQITGADGLKTTLEKALAKGDMSTVRKGLLSQNMSKPELDMIKANMDRSDYVSLIRHTMDDLLSTVQRPGLAQPSDIYDKLLKDPKTRDFYMEALNVPGMENARLKLMFMSKLAGKVKISQGSEEVGRVAERGLQKIAASDGENAANNAFNRKMIKFMTDPEIEKEFIKVLNTPEARNMLINDAIPSKDLVNATINIINNKQLKNFDTAVKFSAAATKQAFPEEKKTERDRTATRLKQGVNPWD